MTPFSTKDPSEIIVLGFNFSNILDNGETVQSATWGAEDGDGEAVTTILQGNPIVSTPIVTQVVTGGTEGAIYMHRAVAVTSANRTLVLACQQRIVKGGYSD